MEAGTLAPQTARDRPALALPRPLARFFEEIGRFFTTLKERSEPAGGEVDA